MTKTALRGTPSYPVSFHFLLCNIPKILSGVVCMHNINVLCMDEHLTVIYSQYFEQLWVSALTSLHFPKEASVINVENSTNLWREFLSQLAWSWKVKSSHPHDSSRFHLVPWKRRAKGSPVGLWKPVFFFSSLWFFWGREEVLSHFWYFLQASSFYLVFFLILPYNL